MGSPSLKFRIPGRENGPRCFICGGDALAKQKKQEAQQQINLNDYMMNLMKNYQGQTTPFWQSRLQNGLPFFNAMTDYNNGTLAHAYAPARGAMERNLAGFGDTLPSGFKMGMENQFNENEGQAFDQNQVNALMMNENAKEAAAASLNPFQPAQLASGTASSVIGAPPVQSGGFGNFLSGMASGLINAGGQAGGFKSLFEGI